MITLKNEARVREICERIDEVELLMRVADGLDYRLLVQEYKDLVSELEAICS